MADAIDAGRRELARARRARGFEIYPGEREVRRDRYGSFLSATFTLFHVYVHRALRRGTGELVLEAPKVL